MAKFSFGHFSVGRKIGLGFSVVLSLLVLTGGVSVYALRAFGDGFSTFSGYVKDVGSAGQIQASMMQTRMAVNEFFSSQDAAAVGAAKSQDEATRLAISSAEAAAQSPEQKELLSTLRDILSQYGDNFSKVTDIQGELATWTSAVELQGPGLSDDLREIAEAAFQAENLALAKRLYAASDRLAAVRSDTYRYLVAPSDQVADEVKTGVEALAKILNDAATAPEAGDQAEKLGALAKKVVRYSIVIGKIRDTVKARGELIHLTLAGLSSQADQAVKQLVEDVRSSTDAVSEQTLGRATTLQWVTVGVCLAAIMLGALLSFLISRLITRPIPGILDVMERAAQGDITVRAKVSSDDEIGKMGVQVNTMLETWQNSLRQVADVAQAIASASAEMSSTSSAMRRGADSLNTEISAAGGAVAHVAESVGDLSSVVTELSANAETVLQTAGHLNASITEVAGHAENSSAIVHRATEGAHQAAEAIAHVGTAMGSAKTNVSELAKAAQDISEVIQVITDIANQTNLLALNATIEAARAGEYGKGFAVVAHEVKQLASATARATEDITAKIHTTQEMVTGSVTAIEDVGSSLERLTSEVEAIGDVIRQIDTIAASIAREVQQQSAASMEIESNIRQMADGTRQVSEDVTKTKGDSEAMRGVVDAITGIAQKASGQAAQTASSANDLDGLSRRLADLVGQFRLAER